MKEPKFNYNKLIQLLDYTDAECIVFVDGQGFKHYHKLQSFIDSVRMQCSGIDDIDTYTISNITVVQSIFDDYKDIVTVYLI